MASSSLKTQPEKSTSASTSTTSKAGIITDADGNSHIPSSVRADGSVRREIRIRPGYRPPEDVEVYRNRAAESFRGRGTAPGVIPGAEPAGDAKDGGDGKGKNAKRREARKKAAAAAAAAGETGETGTKDIGKEDESNNQYGELPNTAKAETVTGEAEADQQKEAKKLLKKLRQARELKDKKDQGTALLPEQFEKVIRINELIRQLDGLGFDTNGEKKEET